MKKMRVILIGLGILLAVMSATFLVAQEEKKPKTKTELLLEEIQKRPENPELYLQLGIAQMEAGDNTLAAQSFTKSEQFFSKTGKSPFLLFRKWGEALYDQGEYDKAIPIFQNALKILPKEYETTRYLQMSEAKRDLLAKKEVTPVPTEEIVSAKYKLALAYYEMNWFDSAKSELEEGLAISKEHKPSQKLLERLKQALPASESWSKGFELANHSDYTNALKEFETALKVFRELEYKQGISSLLGNISNVYSTLGDNVKALEYYNQSLVIQKEIGDRQGEAFSVSGIGFIYFNRGDYAKALGYHNQSLVIRKEIGDHHGEAYSLSDIGEANGRQGEYMKALEYYNQSLVIQKEIGDRQGESASLGNIGNVYSNRGDYAKALGYHNQSLVIRKEIGDRDGEARCFINIGNVFVNLGDYEKTLKFQQEALELSRKIGSKYVEMVSLEAIGEAYYYLGKYPESIQYYTQARKLADELSAKDRIAEIRTITADSYTKQKKFKEAEKELVTALAIYQNLGNKPGILSVLKSLSELYLASGAIDKALDNANKAKELATAIGSKPSLPEIAIKFAKAYTYQKKYPKALEEANTAISLSQEIKLSASLWEAYKIKGDILLKQKKKSEAISAYSQSIEVLRELFGILGKKNRDSFMQDKLEVYESLVGLLMQEGKNEEARKYLEESKQFILRASGTASEGEVRNPETRTIYEDLKQKKQALENLDKKLLEAQNAGQAQGLQAARLKSFREYQEKYEELKSSGEEGQNLYKSLSLNKTSITDFRKTLSSDSILVEYALLENVMYVFWITKEKQGAVKVDVGREKIGDLVHDFRKEVLTHSDKPEESAKLASELHSYLLAPVAEHFKNKKHIIFIPYGVLYFLPFEALHSKDGKFLVESKDVSYYTSTSAIRLSQSKKGIKDKKKMIIAFGNPDGTLKGADKEVDDIAGIFPKISKILKKENASLANFKKDAKNYYIVHLSTHGVLESPASESHIIFGRNLTDKLRLRDIEEFLVDDPDGFKDTQLVVMSACSTAIEKRGFEVKLQSADYSSVPLSLTSAFESISVYSIISTLWDVSDSASKDLMVLFYEKMKTNNYETGKALSEAKREYIKYQRSYKSPKANPYYWAGFILTGDYR